MPPKPTQPTITAEDAATRIARALSDDRKEYEAGMKLVPYSRARAAAVIRDMLAKESLCVSRPSKAAKTAVNRWKGAVDDAAWLDQLEKLPHLQHIDVRRELGKCQLWATTAGQVVSRQRFVAWLNKAQPTIGYNAQGKSSTDKKTAQAPSVYTAPANWQAVLRNVAKTRGWGEDAIDETCALPWEDVSLTIRQEIIKALVA